MTPITDKIKQLPNGFGIFAHAPTDAYEKPERVATSDDLKALVSELDAKTRALDQIRVHAATYKSAAKSDVRRTLNVIDDIAQAALNICQNR